MTSGVMSCALISVMTLAVVVYVYPTRAYGDELV